MSIRISCPLPHHDGEWIERVERVTVGQYQRWRQADHDTTLAMLGELICDWNLTTVPGAPAPKLSAVGLSALDNLDLQLVPWLVHALQVQFAEDMKLPPDNSSPSPTG